MNLKLALQIRIAMPPPIHEPHEPLAPYGSPNMQKVTPEEYAAVCQAAQKKQKGLFSEQKEAVLAYRGPENHG